MKSLLICMTRAPVLFINAKNMSVYDFSEGKEIYRVFVKNTLPIMNGITSSFPSAIINDRIVPCLSCGNNVKQTNKQ